MVVLRSNGPVVYATVREDALGSALAVRESGQIQAPTPRLLDRVREAVRTHHYSHRTVKDLDFATHQIVELNRFAVAPAVP